jgi:hypothetical protein
MPNSFKLLFFIIWIKINIWSYFRFINTSYITFHICLSNMMESNPFIWIRFSFYWILCKYICNKLLILFLTNNLNMLKITFDSLCNRIYLVYTIILYRFIIFISLCKMMPSYITCFITWKYTIICTTTLLYCIDMIKNRIYFIIFNI